MSLSQALATPVDDTVQSSALVPRNGFLEPRCRVCRNNLARKKVNDLLATGASYAMIVRALAADNAKAGLADIVLVGHSMAGLTVPGVVTKLGSPRVRELVLATAFVPPEGKSLVDTLTRPWALTARRNAKKGGLSKTPAIGVRLTYLNGVPRARRKFIAGKVYPESARMLAEKVSRQGMPDEIPRTWILTTRDRALSVKLQHKGIDAIGGVQAIIPLDTCHCLMVSKPERLAEILVERCRRYV
jgi:pimeloyl-ACP methyl ester carboxylesterase